MIIFARAGKPDEVLAEFNKVVGSEKKDAEFLPAIQEKVAADVKSFLDLVKAEEIGLTIKACPISTDQLNLTSTIHSK